MCIGSALQLGDTDVFIQEFWRESTFQSNAAKHAAMKKMHTKSKLAEEDDDESWRNCTRIIEAATAHGDSGLFTTKEERMELFREPVLTAQQRQQQQPSPSSEDANYIFFLQAAQDQPFPYQHCVTSALLEVQQQQQQQASVSSSSLRSRDILMERLRVLGGGDHFNYFTPLKAGGQLENVLRNVEEIVQMYGEPDRLDEWKTTAAVAQRTKPAAAVSASSTSSSSAPSFSSSSSSPVAPRRIVVVGSGVFGLCAAAGLAARYPEAVVTLLEKSSKFPSDRAASNDVSRIVRPDYGADPLYTEWALEATRKWKQLNAQCGEQLYEETGVIFLTKPQSMAPESAAYEAASFRTLQSAPFSLPLLPLRAAAGTNSVCKQHFPYWASSRLNAGYYNPQAGAVNAGRALQVYLARIQRLHKNIVVRTGMHALEIMTEAVGDAGVASESKPKKCVGVRCASGEVVPCDLVVVAAGCWTTQLLPELSTALWPAAQPVLYIRPHRASVGENPSLATTSTTATTSSAARSIYQNTDASQLIPPSQLSIPSAASPAASAAAPLRSSTFPVFSFDLSGSGFYGFPSDVGTGLVKIGHHSLWSSCTPRGPMRRGGP